MINKIIVYEFSTAGNIEALVPVILNKLPQEPSGFLSIHMQMTLGYPTSLHLFKGWITNNHV